jgi:hypothetical protein
VALTGASLPLFDFFDFQILNNALPPAATNGSAIIIPTGITAIIVSSCGQESGHDEDFG